VTTLKKKLIAIDQLCDDNMIMIGDLGGRKEVEYVMEVLEEAYIMGYKHFIIDNLTAFKHTGEDGKSANKVDAVDETMKRLGTFKDEKDVWIMLLSHLKKTYGERKAHEDGGSVLLSDFRGAGSITFWANDIWGVERDTTNQDDNIKLLTCYKNVKSRDVGPMAGTKVYGMYNKDTGYIEQTDAPKKKKKFDNGTTKEKEF